MGVAVCCYGGDTSAVLGLQCLGWLLAAGSECVRERLRHQVLLLALLFERPTFIHALTGTQLL